MLSLLWFDCNLFCFVRLCFLCCSIQLDLALQSMWVSQLSPLILIHNIKRRCCCAEKLQQRRMLIMRRCLLAVQPTTNLSATHSRLATLTLTSSRKRWTSSECPTRCRTLPVHMLFCAFCILLIVILSKFS